MSDDRMRTVVRSSVAPFIIGLDAV